MLTCLIHHFLLCSVIFTYSASNDTIPVKGYHMIWNDEFNGKKLDLTKWDYRGSGKRDDAYLTKDAIRMDGKGHLIIEVSKRNDSVITGMISTENIFKVRYGYFECRAKFTNTRGTFPAFWLQSPAISTTGGTPENSGAEIDIFEYYPHLYKDKVSHAMHWGGYGATHKVEGPVWGNLGKTNDDFHVIGFEWTEDSYTIFVDGKITFTGNQLISKVPEFMILSLGINKQAAGPLSLNNLPDQFTVDYVRVYEKKE